MKMGIVLVLLAALLNASFTLPMKRMQQWSWENIWLMWSLLGLVVLPWFVAIVTVPHLMDGYRQIDLVTLSRVALFGACWGVAQVLFGLSVAQIGMALTFSIVLGISAAVGTVIPFVVLHPALLLTKTGATVGGGVLLVAIGMVFCAMAGQRRQHEVETETRHNQRVPFGTGLALAVVSGLFASFMNLGIAFSDPLLQMAASHGSKLYWCLNAVWLPLLMGGAVPNILYCLYLLWKNGTAGKFKDPKTIAYGSLCLCMAVLWFGSSLLFGLGNFYLGALGPVLGWPIFMSLIVVAASIFGWIAGEWRTVSPKPLRLQLAGVAILSLAIILFSRAGV